MACRWIILICLSAQRIAEGSYENSIILTTVPTIPGFPNTRHIYLIPGTPYDLANNATLYGTYFHFTKTGQLNAKLRSCKVDYSRKILYLYDYSAARVEAIPYFDWQNEFASVTKIVRMHTGVSRGFVKLGVDWVSGNIYWTDPMFRWIAMQPGGTDMIDVGNYKVIVKEDLEKPYALAVDPVGGKLFWSDIAKYPKIEKASLTGENRETIISTGLKFPLSIDVDMSGTDRRIYWVDAARDTVESADLTGGERRIVVRIAHSEFYDVALFRDILSVIDVSRNKVFFINKLNGQHIANPYSRTSETIWGICMYDAETQPEMQDYCSTASCSDICVNEGGQATCLCREGFKLQADLSSCTEDTSKYHRALVLCDGSSIYLADIRSLTAVLAVYNLKKTYASTVGDIKFITLDMVDRKVIFATTTDIYSIAIDMLNPTALHIVTSQNNITGLTMDWQDKNIYWTLGQSSGEIRVVSQEGGSIFRLQSGLNNPRGLKVLSLENKMVWISGTYFSNKIELSNIDGTERKTIVSSASLTDPKSLGFDSHTNRLYWIDSGHIKRVYINGTGLEILAASTVSPKLFLTYQDYLVWTEDNTTTSSIILTADVRNPALTLIKDSFADVGAISAMAVLDESLQPLQKGPCEADNGECEHICIPIGKNRICKCEYGFTKDANGRTCSSIPFEDNFILVTDWTHNKIYQISLISDDVRAMDIDSTGNPNAVLYQPIEKRVIWADTKDKNIHSSYLNGSDHKVIINKGVVDSYADRLAVDSTSGNLYYTSVNATVAGGFKGVSVISPNGDSLDLVTGGYAPRDIAVDPAKGLMFWTDHGSVPTVKKANMDGTSVTVIVSANIKWPNGIAIDYQVQQLYLSDGYLDTIQKCTYSGFCSIIYTDAGAHLMDIELSEHYLYFTAWNKPYITKMNKNSPSDITRLAANAELGRLDSIYIYSSSAAKQPVNVDCAADQGLGDCSTLCLPTNNGRRCACSNNVDLWPNSNVCEDISKCGSHIQNGEIIGACTNLHKTQCSYDCHRFYTPSTQDGKITCFYGLWSVTNPCSFSDVKCPQTVDKVVFDSACSYNNSDTCTYDCIPGYTPSSATKTMTCDKGIWDNQTPCDEIVPDCPSNVDKVSFPDTCYFQNNEQCTYTCLPGYRPTAEKLVCISKTWNLEEPCEAITCSETVDKVDFEPSCTFDDGVNCTYGCISGYTPTTSNRTLICDSGTWDNQHPCIKIDCPTDLEQVIFPGTCTFQNDEECAFSCAPGTRPTVTNSRMSCIGGSWNVLSPCRVPKCSTHIQNGEIVGTCTYLPETECSFKCDRFYRSSAQDSKITCFDGQWNMSNPCSFSDAECPRTFDKVLFHSACSYNNSETCTYDCIPGYTPSSAAKTMTCDKGIWDNQKPCDEIVPDCPTVVDKVMFPDSCYFQNGEECMYNCTSGFVPTAGSMVCSGSAWNTVEPCQALKCSQTDNAVIFESCSYESGDSCVYSCGVGFAPTSSDRTLTCVRGVWDNASPCVHTDCPTNIETVIFPGTCTFQNDEQCAYSCTAGTRPTVSDSRMTCIGGSWNIHSPCEDAKCIKAVDKVLFNSTCSFKYSETCTYSCIQGYTPSSSSGTLTCVDGEWDSQDPCDELVPDCPNDVDKVLFQGACYFQNNERCTYTCLDGYRPIAEEIVCIGRNWNLEKPCEDITCSETVDKVDFEPSCTFDVGESCKYGCVSGYTPTASDKTLTCDSGGAWGNQQPCVQIDCATDIDHVIFPGTCTFQNDEECAFSCAAGARPTITDSRMTCIGGSWNVHTPCEVPKCSNQIHNGEIIGACTYLHKTECSFKCDRFYRPTTQNSKITCVDGQWNMSNPCLFSVPDCPTVVDNVTFSDSCTFQSGEECIYNCTSGLALTAERLICSGSTWTPVEPCEDLKCSETVDEVIFESCNYENGERCKYKCEVNYTPTSTDRTLTCVSGAWDNSSPCVQIDCPTNIEKVIFPGTCTFQNDEQCAYSCETGTRPRVSDSRMTCIGGSWNIHNPCEDAKCPHTVDKVLFHSACNYNYGETCTYNCTQGYTPSSISGIMTCEDGVWDVQSPCNKMVPDCPTKVDKVSFPDTCYFQSNEQCTYTCLSGYRPKAETLLCMSNYWNLEEPCEEITCSEIVDKVNFDPSCNFDNGESCTYGCVSGYTPTASDRTLRCDSGTWDNQQPCVKIDCPKDIDHVEFPGTCTFQNDEECAFSCAAGARPTITDSRMTCIGGSWNVHAPCKVPKCSNQIQNGEIIGACTYLLETECSYVCDRFYRPSTQDRKITCFDGQWNRSNPCSFSDAKCPHTVDKVLFHSACSYNNSETCTYDCISGYTPSSVAKTMTCDSGIWDNQKPCDEIVPDCPTVVDKVSFPSTCNFQNGEECTYNCSSGFVPKAGNMVCNGSTWNIVEPCEDHKCTEIVDKVILESCSYESGESCVYSCVVGFTPTSNDRTLTCNLGAWDNTIPCVKIDCPTGIDKVIFPGTCTFQNDEQCAYSCAAGTRPTVSDSRMTCIGGSWNIHSPCEDAECTKKLDKVLFDSSCSYHYGETCIYGCIQGYTPSSSSGTITCDDGVWDNQSPCDEIVPDCPTHVDKVSFPDTCYHQNNEQCTYTCLSGYRPVAEKLVCIGQKWNIEQPCEDISCSETVDKVDFEPSCTYDDGESCKYECIPGFTPAAGDRTLICNGGTWNIENPCLKIDCPTNIDYVKFPGTCTFQNDEECAYSCDVGARPTITDSRMTCIGGSWNVHIPCTAITTTQTTTATTKPSATSSMSSSTQKAAATSAPQVGPSIVPISAGAVAGALVLLAVIIAAIIVVIRKRAKQPPLSQTVQDFESSCYQGFENYAEIADMPASSPASQQPDSIYDFIRFDELNARECESKDTDTQHGNVYTTMAERGAGSGDYETLFHETSDYLKPANSNNPFADYLKPVNLNNAETGFI